MFDENGVYYRLFLGYHDRMCVVCMQSFDEYDYDQNRFYRDENGDKYIFWDEKEAIDFLNEKFKREFIDEEYLRDENLFNHMLKEEAK